MPDTNPTSPPRLTLTLDMEKYLSQIDDWDITETQKQEFIETLWGLLVSFAELGFEISPVEQALKACGQVGENSRKAALTAPDAVCLNDQKLLNKFSRGTEKPQASKEAP